MQDAALQAAIDSVPPGPWAVGVSGGADSVALLALLRRRADLALHVVHLDHEARGAESAADAAFVAELAGRWGLDCTVARWRDVEADVPPGVTNRSARFRLGRRILFRRAVEKHALAGVALAHHADDQAETVMLRLMRGSGAIGLGGMAPRAVLDGLAVLRPLLQARRAALRAFLLTEGLAWREDESNASDRYLRNRVRKLLVTRDDLTAALLETADAARALAEWVRGTAPRVGAGPLDARTLRDVPAALAREAARRWLAAAGVPHEELSPEVLDRLLFMARDAASPPRLHFPGGVLVGRRSGRLFVVGAAGGPGET